MATRADKVAIRRLAPAKQRRLDELMAKNNDGDLSPVERHEFENLASDCRGNLSVQPPR